MEVVVFNYFDLEDWFWCCDLYEEGLFFLFDDVVLILLYESEGIVWIFDLKYSMCCFVRCNKFMVYYFIFYLWSRCILSVLGLRWFFSILLELWCVWKFWGFVLLLEVVFLLCFICFEIVVWSFVKIWYCFIK